MCTDSDKWVPVCTAYRDLRLRMEKRLSLWREASNILNKQFKRPEKLCPSSGLNAN